jgi:hypothetical protein
MIMKLKKRPGPKGDLEPVKKKSDWGVKLTTNLQLVPRS